MSTAEQDVDIYIGNFKLDSEMIAVNYIISCTCSAQTEADSNKCSSCPKHLCLFQATERMVDAIALVRLVRECVGFLFSTTSKFNTVASQHYKAEIPCTSYSTRQRQNSFSASGASFSSNALHAYQHFKNVMSDQHFQHNVGMTMAP
jgi:hypothetical protein